MVSNYEDAVVQAELRAAPKLVAAPKGNVDKEDEDVHKVRALLAPQWQDVDTATVRRFIAATNGNLNQSAKRLAATCAWRQQHQPERVVCTACAKDPRSHYMHIVGHDAVGRPIIYSCFAAAKNRVFADNKAHMIQTFEMAVRLMPPGVQNWVWVCDFEGFGMADLNPALAKAFLDVSATHYPERLGLFCIVDAPSLFSVLWKAIQSFVDPKTYTKIRFLPWDLKAGGKSQLRGCLEEFCEPDTASWLLQEMSENRDSKRIASKLYDQCEIHRAASTGGLQISQPHDLRGTAALLSKYQSSPAVLEPLPSVTGHTGVHHHHHHHSHSHGHGHGHH